MFFQTCGLFLPPSERCLLSVQLVECTGHLDYFLNDWWRLVSARWQKELKRNYDQTTSRASVAAAVLLVPFAMQLLQQQYLVAWQPTHYPPCPPEHYAEALRAVSGWTWLDPKECPLVGAVGLAPCAVALLVVGQVPTTTNGMLMYAKYRNHLGLSCHFLPVQYVLKVSIFQSSNTFCYFYHHSHQKYQHQTGLFTE